MGQCKGTWLTEPSYLGYCSIPRVEFGIVFDFDDVSDVAVYPLPLLWLAFTAKEAACANNEIRLPLLWTTASISTETLA